MQEFTKYLTHALALIRTFSCKQQKTAEAGGSENGAYYKHTMCFVEPRWGNVGGPQGGVGQGTGVQGSPGLF